MTGAASSDSTNSAPLSPPPITPVGGSASFAVSAPTAGGPTPPPVISAPAGSQGRNVSTQAMTVNGGSSGGAGAMTASGAFSAASAEAEALEQAQESGAGGAGWSEGMQTLAAVVGCAAVGTVLWSEFVLKDTGMGLLLIVRVRLDMRVSVLTSVGTERESGCQGLAAASDSTVLACWLQLLLPCSGVLPPTKLLLLTKNMCVTPALSHLCRECHLKHIYTERVHPTVQQASGRGKSKY
jgi:hypothetical protein